MVGYRLQRFGGFGIAIASGGGIPLGRRIQFRRRYRNRKAVMPFRQAHAFRAGAGCRVIAIKGDGSAILCRRHRNFRPPGVGAHIGVKIAPAAGKSRRQRALVAAGGYRQANQLVGLRRVDGYIHQSLTAAPAVGVMVTAKVSVMASARPVGAVKVGSAASVADSITASPPTCAQA